MKNKIICISAVIIIIIAMLPTSGAINIVKNEEELESIINSEENIQKMLFIGRISNLTTDENSISFIPRNIIIIAKIIEDDDVTSYIGHIKRTNYRYQIPSDHDFRGWLTDRFIYGVARYKPEELQKVTPTLSLDVNYTEKTIKIIGIGGDGPIPWNDMEINGYCDKSELGTFIEPGDVIKDCRGKITIKYIPSNNIYGTWTFT